MTVHLPEDLESYVRATVLRGRFASEDEAITEAVRLLRQAEAKESHGAGQATPANLRGRANGSEPAWKRFLNVMEELPGEVFDTIPADGSEQLDHYLYGSPKRTNS